MSPATILSNRAFLQKCEEDREKCMIHRGFATKRVRYYRILSNDYVISARMKMVLDLGMVHNLPTNASARSQKQVVRKRRIFIHTGARRYYIVPIGNEM